MISHFANQRITVMGLGRFGGGLGVTRWLLQQGAHVTLTDLADEAELHEPLTDLRSAAPVDRLTLHLGGHAIDDFTSADGIVVNPAVPKPWDNPFLTAAREAGVPLTTEIRLVAERIDRSRTIGVTGTAGKSTTAAIIHHLLTATGHTSHLAGNIGGSLLDRLDMIAPDDFIVLELSSAMLHWLDAGVRADIGDDTAPGWSPHIAVITMIAPNHLDWHGSFEHYQQSKQVIVAHQTEGDHAVTTEQIHARRPLPLSIPGDHNQTNGFLAINAVLHATGALPSQTAPLLAEFPGLPHRLQKVATHGEQTFYNDSKSTTPEATVLAVQAFKRPSAIHLIAGGYDKGIDLSPITELRPQLAGLYTIGATGAALAEQAMQVVDDSKIGAGHVEYAGTLEDAVRSAMTRMGDADMLLLSPGCASWDQFEHYEARGERFVELIP